MVDDKGKFYCFLGQRKSKFILADYVEDKCVFTGDIDSIMKEEGVKLHENTKKNIICSYKTDIKDN